MISIIIAAYNAASFITTCIDSCLNLLGSETEIIIINDGSTDNLLQKCDDLGYTEKGYIKILSFKNFGFFFVWFVGL